MENRQYVISNGNYSTMWDIYMDEVNGQSSGYIVKYYHSGIANKGPISNIIDDIVNCLDIRGWKVGLNYQSNHIFKIKNGSAQAVMKVECSAESERERPIVLTIVGERELAKEISLLVGRKFENIKSGSLKWYYKRDGRTDNSTMPIDGEKKPYNEFYPWIKEGVDSYIDRFMASDSAILLMIGPPGTGKTSLLRYLISSRGLMASFTYDESLLESDELFFSFITGDSDLLVIEDADTLICSRESGNKLISRFLNAAEGLAKVRGKKIVFTTNLATIKDVDEALIRPGRCFDVMKTRLLTHKEMLAATAAAGIEVPEWKEGYSLCELFSPIPIQTVRRKVGF